LPLAIGIYIWGVVRLVLKLLDGNGAAFWHRALAFFFALSVGAVIFGAIFLAQYALPGQFHYGWLKW
jgi:hypothetical protein